MPLKLPKGALDVLAEVKNSEQVKSALALLEKYLTPDNQLPIVKQLVNVPPKNPTLDHMALSAMGDRYYLDYPNSKGSLAPLPRRLEALEEWKQQLAPDEYMKGFYNQDMDFADWLSDGLRYKDSMVLPGDEVTKHLDNLSIQLPHPLELYKTSGRSPENYVQKPWHSTTLNPDWYKMREGVEAGFRVPGGTPLVFSQGLADRDEVLAPMNDLIKYRFKAKGGLVALS